MYLPKPKIVPPLDPSFRPAVLANHAFLDAVRSSGNCVPLVIALEGKEGFVSVFRTEVFAEGKEQASENLMYVERLVKTLLWQRGGWRIVVGGPRSVGEHIKKMYAPGRSREFDADIMSGVYEKPFTVEVADVEDVPEAQETAMPLGRHLEGCRIGFDLGASDRKVAAVVDGEPVFTEEIPWNPSEQSDPEYHYKYITEILRSAAFHMPRVDAIGGSAAGIYINNRVRVASLFRGVPKNLFDEKVKDMFLRIKEEWGVPLVVVHDGEVAALAGSMSLNVNQILGIAMGSSEAGGYVNKEGNITSWLNELAFIPVDFNPSAPVDEWSGDRGCGAQYFSQQAVLRLAPKAGITLDENQTPAEKLKFVQNLLAKGDNRARLVFETIGCYFGYGIAYYADFYDLRYVLMLGRVTSGEGGSIILRKAREVLDQCFPSLAERIKLNIPGEAERRVGQAVAAASLPVI
ncbi:MAG: ROK family protein [Hadesarchaea archaeon]|nr:ROK family protein [Hadesarchaea archaeon]MDH5685197.1 ROK family protein [Hadesarchaea archaeon]